MRSWWMVAVSGCAHAIAPVTPPMVAPPPATASGVTACWVEFARAGAFTASGIAVRGPSGVVLVDVGQSLAFREELKEVPTGRFYLRLVPAKLVPDEAAADVLAASGVDPAELVAVVPTHVHSDHAGGLMDLPDVPVHVHPTELELLHAVVEGQTTAFNVMPAQARRILGEAEPLPFVDAPYEVFPRHADLLGDGTVVAVPLEGHTPGSVGVLVDTGKVRLFDAGDAINTRDRLDHPRTKSLLLRPTDADHDAADEQVAVLAALHEADPSLVILPAHERRAWVEAFGAPGACIGG
ncbi:MAG: MBL fold metallo-hydrolase [Myxococcota bacterium]